MAGRPVARALLALVLLVGVGLRGYRIDFQLPYLYHPDEPTNMAVVDRMVRGLDPNPRFFNYPSLLFDVQAVVGLARGVIVGEQPPPVVLALGNGRATDEGQFVAARLVTVAVGLVAVVLAWALGRRLTGRVLGGAVAAAAVAVSPLSAIASRLVVPDVYAAACSTGAVLAALAVVRAPTMRAYLVAGAMCGLAAGAKYNAGITVLAVAAAHLLSGDPFRRWRAPLAAAVAAGAAFVLTTPFALLSPRAFVRGVRAETLHYSTGHAAFEGGTLLFNLRAVVGDLGPLAYLVPVGIVLGLAGRHRRSVAVALAFALPYFGLISLYQVRFDRNLLPIQGVLVALVALAVCAAAEAIDRPRLMVLLATLGVMSALVTPLRHVLDGLRPLGTDERAGARRWLDRNLPTGSVIALEAYTPWVDPERHTVVGVVSLADRPLRDYRRAGVDVVLASAREYRRYTDHPDRYPVQAGRYRALMRAFPRHTRIGHGLDQQLVLRR